MITRINVDGFRSLSNFDLILKPGLNILIGPNGSGKTNVISFFEFMSFLVSLPLSEAISKLGGAGSAFRKVTTESYQENIEATIYGRLLPNQLSPKGYTFYKYAFTVAVTPDKDMVFFKKQSFSISTNKEANETEKTYNSDYKWDIDLEIEAIMANKPNEEQFTPAGVNSKIKRIDRRKVKPYWYNHGLSADERETRASSELKSNMLLHDTILKYIPTIFKTGSFVERDIYGGETINIDPAMARKNEDSAAPPGIKRDGSGLTATLYALSKNKNLTAQNNISGGFYSPSAFRNRLLSTPNENESTRKGINSLSRIESLSRLVNFNISKISVSNSALDNLTQASIWISSGETNVQLPFSSMSDGTVKWIALVTAIITHKNIFAIEEPENFLHPSMQKELLGIMRDETSARKKNSFVIMTTHSESLLNAAQPNEVIVVSFEEGRTVARRPTDADAIAAEINRTGFGLGYYYLSGALNDA